MSSILYTSYTGSSYGCALLPSAILIITGDGYSLFQRFHGLDSYVAPHAHGLDSVLVNFL